VQAARAVLGGFVCLQRQREVAVVRCTFDALARVWQ